MATPRRDRSIAQYLNLLVKDLEKTIDDSTTRDEWYGNVRNILIYWMGVMYDEGSGYTKDLETSITILRKQVEHLKQWTDTSDDKGNK